MQGKMVRSVKKRASTPQYVSPNQLILEGFDIPFEQKSTLDNRWVTMSKLIPWDEIVSFYNHQFSATEGRPPINGRIILVALMIKHIEALSDRATIQHIRENMFMQYFLGYSSFTNEEPFSDTLFVEIRKRLSLDLLSKINEIIVLHCVLDPEDNINGDRIPPPTNNGSETSRSERNLGHIDVLLEAYDSFPLKYRDLKYLKVLRTVYQQQEQLHRTRSTRIEHRIVNIHQPHVRPIVRGKTEPRLNLEVSYIVPGRRIYFYRPFELGRL